MVIKWLSITKFVSLAKRYKSENKIGGGAAYSESKWIHCAKMPDVCYYLCFTGLWQREVNLSSAIMLHPQLVSGFSSSSFTRYKKTSKLLTDPLVTILQNLHTSCFDLSIIVSNNFTSIFWLIGLIQCCVVGLFVMLIYKICHKHKLYLLPHTFGVDYCIKNR